MELPDIKALFADWPDCMVVCGNCYHMTKVIVEPLVPAPLSSFLGALLFVCLAFDILRIPEAMDAHEMSCLCRIADPSC